MELEDEEIINKIAAIEELAQFGKYDIIKLKGALLHYCSLDLTEDNVAAMQRKGFVEVDYQITGQRNDNVITFFTFNDRWRNLKRFNNYDAFIRWEIEEKEQEIEKVKTERLFIKSQNEFLKINNDFVKKQSELIDSQLKTNEIAKTTNIFIAVFTFIAAIYYGFEFCKDYISNCNPNKRIIENITIVILGMCGIWLLLLVFQRWRQANIKPKP